MKPIICARRIDAPTSMVFATVADIRKFSEAVPHITKVEFLTDQQSGPGTRFRETRIMNGCEVSTELEVTEVVEDERIRIVSDSGGTIWDTVFTVTSLDGETDLNLAMEIRPYKLLAKVTMPMFRGKVVKGVKQDMDCVKQYCERQTGDASASPSL